MPTGLVRKSLCSRVARFGIRAATIFSPFPPLFRPNAPNFALGGGERVGGMQKSQIRLLFPDERSLSKFESTEGPRRADLPARVARRSEDEDDLRLPASFSCQLLSFSCSAAEFLLLLLALRTLLHVLPPTVHPLHAPKTFSPSL